MSTPPCQPSDAEEWARIRGILLTYGPDAARAMGLTDELIQRAGTNPAYATRCLVGLLLAHRGGGRTQRNAPPAAQVVPASPATTQRLYNATLALLAKNALPVFTDDPASLDEHRLAGMARRLEEMAVDIGTAVQS